MRIDRGAVVLVEHPVEVPPAFDRRVDGAPRLFHVTSTRRRPRSDVNTRHAVTAADLEWARRRAAMARKVAFVTGASRGIGKACAVHLARAGFDVAVTARTVHDGERREHSSTLRASNTKPLPGSLSGTAAAIEAAGVRALALPADLLDHASLAAAAAIVLERWGRVDVLVQNGRYIGPGHMDLFLDTPLDLLDKHLQANVLAPLLLAKRLLPGMLERGEGRILDVTSAAGYGDPPRPAGAGGWGMGYGISKAAFHRIAGFLAVELGERGILAVNLQPGLIRTERLEADMGEFGFTGGAPPDVMGAVAAWFATESEAFAWNGQTVEAQYFCRDRALLTDWDGPWVGPAVAAKYDLAGAKLAELEDRRRRELGMS
jgi:NAD(P)-dependent dehydrogenase (short-subunit alcohol dehydrogenase family)